MRRFLERLFELNLERAGSYFHFFTLINDLGSTSQARGNQESFTPRKKPFIPISDLIRSIEKDNKRAESSKIHATFSPIPISRPKEAK
jgi:hypothetical protein